MKRLSTAFQRPPCFAKQFEKYESEKIYTIELPNKEKVDSLVLQWNEAHAPYYENHMRYELFGKSNSSNARIPCPYTLISIIDGLLSDYYVFTLIEDDIVDDTIIKEFMKYSLTPLSFSASYARYLKAHDWNDGAYCFNNKNSLITVTKGSNLPLLKAFYATPGSSRVIAGCIYAFNQPPVDIDGFDYETTNRFISTKEPNILLLNLGNEATFDIIIDCHSINGKQLAEKLKFICKKLGSSLFSYV